MPELNINSPPQFNKHGKPKAAFELSDMEMLCNPPLPLFFCWKWKKHHWNYLCEAYWGFTSTLLKIIILTLFPKIILDEPKSPPNSQWENNEFKKKWNTWRKTWRKNSLLGYKHFCIWSRCFSIWKTYQKKVHSETPIDFVKTLNSFILSEKFKVFRRTYLQTKDSRWTWRLFCILLLLPLKWQSKAYPLQEEAPQQSSSRLIAHKLLWYLPVPHRRNEFQFLNFLWCALNKEILHKKKNQSKRNFKTGEEGEIIGWESLNISEEYFLLQSKAVSLLLKDQLITL